MSITDLFIYAKTIVLVLLLFIDIMLLIMIISGVLMFAFEIFSPSPKEYTSKQYLGNFKMICFYVTGLFVLWTVIMYLIAQLLDKILYIVYI